MPRARDGGFTLLEMIVVLAVLTLLGGLVLARGPQRSSTLDLRQAAATVAGALRGARGRAIAGNAAVAVGLDAPSRRVLPAGGTARTLPSDVLMVVAVPEGQGARIVFMPDGSASGGTVVLSARGQAARVGVDWLSGRVSVSAVGPDAR